MKNYKTLREHRRPLPTPPYASEPADDIDINLGVLDEESISRINAYLQQQHGTYINPNNALNKIQRRLASVGLIFTYPKDRPYVQESTSIRITDESFPVSYMGGRSGVLDNNYTIGTDDNIRWRTGYGINLKVSYSMQDAGGFVSVLPKLEIVKGVTESASPASREDAVRRAKIKVDRDRKGLKSQFAKWSLKKGYSRNSTEQGLEDIGSDHRSINPYDRNPRQDRISKSLSNLKRKKFAPRINGQYTEDVDSVNENSTLTTRYDQARNAEHGLNKAVNRAKKSIARRDSRTGASRELTNSKLKSLVNMKRDGKLNRIDFTKMGMHDVGNEVKKAENRFAKKSEKYYDASSKEADRDARVLRNRARKYGS